MKLKNKKFKIRQEIRKAKREKHQRTIAKLMQKLGGGLSFNWFMHRVKVAEKIEKHKKKKNENTDSV